MTYDQDDPRFSLANERTFLAWMRTALALLAGGLAVHAPGLDLDTWAATTLSLVLLAAAVLCSWLAWSRWRATERAMSEGAPLPGFGGPTVLVAVVGLLAAGIAIGVILSAA